jgi:uncharacterized membrane protein
MVTRHILAWLMLMLVAIANGVLREFTYGRYLQELTAHQVSTALGMLFTGLIAWRLSRLWPLPGAAAAWTVGTIWLLLTIVFEFGFGHFVAGHDWSRLLQDYDLAAGRVWTLFLVWVLIMPPVFHAVRRSP